MTLSETQIEFLIKHFFPNDEVAGMNGIGRKLLTAGGCIVAGDGRLWLGGVGNFITQSEPTVDVVGCTQLTMDVEVFVKSAMVQNFIEESINELGDYIVDLSDNMDKLKHKQNSLGSIIFG